MNDLEFAHTIEKKVQELNDPCKEAYKQNIEVTLECDSLQMTGTGFIKCPFILIKISKVLGGN